MDVNRPKYKYYIVTVLQFFVLFVQSLVRECLDCLQIINVYQKGGTSQKVESR